MAASSISSTTPTTNGSSAVVHPPIRVKANDIADGKVNAGIPVDQYENVENQLANAKNVGKGGARLRPVKAVGDAVETKQPVHAHHHRTGIHQAGNAVQSTEEEVQVGGQHWEEV